MCTHCFFNPPFSPLYHFNSLLMKEPNKISDPCSFFICMSHDFKIFSFNFTFKYIKFLFVWLKQVLVAVKILSRHVGSSSTTWDPVPPPGIEPRPPALGAQSHGRQITREVPWHHFTIILFIVFLQQMCCLLYMHN